MKGKTGEKNVSKFCTAISKMNILFVICVQEMEYQQEFMAL